MKIKYFLLVVFFLFIYQTGLCQLVHFHTHLNNNDAQTRQQLNILIGAITARNVELTAINGLLTKILANHKLQLSENYSRNLFDKKDPYLTNSASTIALSMATSILNEYVKMPYMTSTKRDYLKAVALDKAILLTLQFIDVSKVTSSKRQEIYRLRSELIRELSKNDQESRKMLMFCAAGWMVMDYAAFIKLKNKLDAVEITF